MKAYEWQDAITTSLSPSVKIQFLKSYHKFVKKSPANPDAPTTTLCEQLHFFHCCRKKNLNTKPKHPTLNFVLIESFDPTVHPMTKQSC